MTFEQREKAYNEFIDHTIKSTEVDGYLVIDGTGRSRVYDRHYSYAMAFARNRNGLSVGDYATVNINYPPFYKGQYVRVSNQEKTKYRLEPLCLKNEIKHDVDVPRVYTDTDESGNEVLVQTLIPMMFLSIDNIVCTRRRLFNKVAYYTDGNTDKLAIIKKIVGGPLIIYYDQMVCNNGTRS